MNLSKVDVVLLIFLLCELESRNSAILVAFLCSLYLDLSRKSLKCEWLFIFNPVIVLFNCWLFCLFIVLLRSYCVIRYNSIRI